MKAYLLKINDRKRQTVGVTISLLLIIVSLITTELTSALCHLSSFAILLGLLWLKVSESLLENRR
ncbi:hypothetical protein [Photobacterium carnosum]|uniref:hypothetical protein n=1 Tax=Photobacterium carnosum TaxID=2023717 RepID=UPI001E39C350|nr:hypothetical protein [Photobacterium carnosum]MCD9500202.1 hypothetical protein [Photobacterium carnosum]